MVATFLQSELADELKKILSDFRLKNPQGERVGINIFEQLLPMPEPLDQGEIAPELLENRPPRIRTPIFWCGLQTARSRTRTAPRK